MKADFVGLGRRFTALGIPTALVLCLAFPPMISTNATASPMAARARPALLVRFGRTEAIPKNAITLGPVPGSSTLQFQVVLSPRQPKMLRAMVTAVTTPGSPSYRQFLPRGVFTQLFGASDRTLHQLQSILRGLGLHDQTIAPDRLAVTVRASAAEVGRALHTQIMRYRSASGEPFLAPREPPALPRVAASRTSAILGLDTAALVVPSGIFLEHSLGAPVLHANSSATYAGVESPACGSAITAAHAGLTPDQFASAYGLSPLYQGGDVGAGVTIGVIEFSSFSASDVNTYASCLGVTPSITEVPIDGGPRGAVSQFPAVAGNTLESELDLEILVGLAPGSPIIDYEGASQSGAISNAAAYEAYAAAINDDAAKIITTSYGVCEALISRSEIKAENTLFEQAALQGQTVIAAAGDNGSEDCSNGASSPLSSQSDPLAVDDPASQPFVTGVGGTTLALSPTKSEVVWNAGRSSTYFQSSAGGGGVSTVWPIPAYQSAAASGLGVIEAARSAGTCQLAGGCREVPDVALNAGSPYAIYCTVSTAGCGDSGSDWTPLGGTSAAAPAFASIIALADASPSCAAVLPAASPSLGFINPELYAIASGSGYSSSFTDITSGNNDLLGIHGGAYPARVGYDLASGLGSPIATSTPSGGLVSGLCSPGALTAATLQGGLTTPKLHSIAPKSGSPDGGREVVIEGSGLLGSVGVLFGSVPASNFRVASATRIVAVAPPGKGKVHVSVIGRGGMSTWARGGTYSYIIHPQVFRIAPPSGPSTGHDVVVIIGSGFRTTRSVRFGQSLALSFRVRSSSRIIATVPAGHGVVRVVVTTRGSHSATGSGAVYTYR